jgi:hypothetical protein
VGPSKKLTVPVALGGETVAVRVTAWQKVDGFGELDSVRLVGIGRTTCWVVADRVLSLNESKYDATSVCVPTDSVETVIVATPVVLLIVAVPIVGPPTPSWKVTVLENVDCPGGGLKIAVRVTGLPNAEGFGELVRVNVEFDWPSANPAKRQSNVSARIVRNLIERRLSREDALPNRG